MRFAPGSPALAAAARALERVLVRGSTAEQALADIAPHPANRAAARAILAGTLRAFPRLITAVDPLVQSGSRSPQPWLRALLVTAIHQIEHSRAAAAPVVNIAVDAARVLGEPKAAGLVNAVLRRFLREREDWLAAVARDPAVAAAHPSWLYDALAAAWPGAAFDDLIAANNEAPPMTLRVDLSRQTRDDAIARLAAAGHAAVASWWPSAIVLREPVAVESLPGFAEGELSVQDAGAQLAAALVEPASGLRILDACAAPGGKTGHLLELAPGIDLTALDVDPDRLERVAANLSRLRREARLVAADLRDPDRWWDGRPFDVVLVDAPCSGTGVIRRHPDIKLLRRRKDIDGFAKAQRELIAAAVAVLRPGGRLVYSTCSVLPGENAAVVEAALRDLPVEIGPLVPPALPRNAVAHANGLQLLPTPVAAGPAGVTDGFHYVCLHVRDGRER